MTFKTTKLSLQLNFKWKLFYLQKFNDCLVYNSGCSHHISVVYFKNGIFYQKKSNVDDLFLYLMLKNSPRIQNSSFKKKR